MRTCPGHPYRYQPFGPVSHPERSASGRFYGVAGLSGQSEGQLRGLTKEEADAIVGILVGGTPPAAAVLELKDGELRGFLKSPDRPLDGQFALVPIPTNTAPEGA